MVLWGFSFFLGASLVTQLVKNPPAMQETWFDSWVGKICGRRNRLPTPVFLGFPGTSASKESTCNVGDLGSIPGLWNHLPQIGTWTYVLGLEPSQNPAWDLNPCGWDSNPVKTLSIWFQDLMKLRFLMFHCRKNSVRDKVIGKWIYSESERSTLHRVWAVAEGECDPEIWCG